MEGKTVIPHPRDMIAAANVILDIARKGVIPEGYAQRRQMVEADKAEKAEHKEPIIPILGVNPQFTRISAIGPDGTDAGCLPSVRLAPAQDTIL